MRLSTKIIAFLIVVIAMFSWKHLKLSFQLFKLSLRVRYLKIKNSFAFFKLQYLMARQELIKHGWK